MTQPVVQTEPTVDFREYVNEPGSRQLVRRIVQTPKLALTMDAVGIRAKTLTHDCTYPWTTVSCATNVPRAKT